jgi:hypothetical protein
MIMQRILVTLATVALSLTASAGQYLFPGSGVVRIIGVGAFAHGCVVEGKLYTNYHVMDKVRRVSWSDLDGREGIAHTKRENEARDIVLLETDVPVGEGFKRAAAPPAAGEMLRTFGYSKGDTDFFAPRVLETKAVRTSAGHLSYVGGLFEGSSGACVLNEAGEVVGINSFYVPHSERPAAYPLNGTEKLTSFAVLITGRWNDTNEETQKEP